MIPNVSGECKITTSGNTQIQVCASAAMPVECMASSENQLLVFKSDEDRAYYIRTRYISENDTGNYTLTTEYKK